MTDDQLRLLREARDMLGVAHRVVPAPGAQVVGGADSGFTDVVPDPECPVCDLARRIDEALR